MTVQHRRTNNVAQVISNNGERVKVRFTDENIADDKREFEMAISTYKRWWKVIDDVAGDGTPLADVCKEIAKQAKQKAKKATTKKATNKQKTKKAPVKAEKQVKHEKKVDGIVPLNVAEQVCKDLGLVYKANKNNIGVKVDNKRVLDIFGRNTQIRIYVKSDNPTYATLDKKLYEIRGAGSGNKDVSMYVDTANIETVIKHLMDA